MPSIFLSYRRSDAPGHAGRLYDRLVDRFGETGVFKDLDSMEPGADFGEVIEETVARCDALIAVIGRDWLAADETGVRRLDSPEDWVRLEIGHALKRDVRVIPVLVEGARMPSAVDLPADLQALARRHAVELSESAWNPQVRQLIDALETLLAKAPPPQPVPEAPRAQRVTPTERGRTRLMEELAARGFQQSARTNRLFYHPALDGFRVALAKQVARLEYQRDDGTWELDTSFSLAKDLDRAVDALAALTADRPAALHDLVANAVHEILTAENADAFRIVESRAQPGDYIQWIGSPEGFRVEISDPGRNEAPPRPLTPHQLAAIDRLGFAKEPDANFARIFEFSEALLPHIASAITTAFADVFGLTEADQVAVFGDGS
jgi:TIR domain-containing protein/type III secretion system-like peptide-binding chaperone